VPPVRVAVILPAFNEHESITRSVTLVQEAVARLDVPADVIVVDDGSTDGTGDLAATCGARVIRHAINRGYGAALKSGILGTEAPVVLIMDADCSYPVDAIPRLLERLADADMAVGHRVRSSGVPLVRRPAKWILNRFAGFLIGRRVPDLNSGQRAMRRDVVLRYLHLMPNGFSFTSTITLAMLANGHPVIYEPIAYVQRTGHSKIRAAHFAAFMLLVVRAVVLFNPLKVFVPLGVLFLAIGGVVLIRDATAPVGHFSAGAVVAFAAALLSWAVGGMAACRS
jgi:glycosyltransferase involved in cell wall biosynthesis